MNLGENIKHPREINGIIRRYYAVWTTYALAGGFLFGVYPIFLKARGLNQFEINSVLAMYFVVLFLTDVPTGAFADALGRRRSFVLGAALRVCAFLLYFTAHHYWVFLIGESIDGIGTTFGNPVRGLLQCLTCPLSIAALKSLLHLIKRRQCRLAIPRPLQFGLPLRLDPRGFATLVFGLETGLLEFRLL